MLPGQHDVTIYIAYILGIHLCSAPPPPHLDVDFEPDTCQAF
jgi:hypothetical protein